MGCWRACRRFISTNRDTGWVCDVPLFPILKSRRLYLLGHMASQLPEGQRESARPIVGRGAINTDT